VTAELVLALPAVLLIMTIAVAAMSLQSAKLQLINAAAMVASAVARGEPDALIDQLVTTAGDRVTFELEELEDMICVKLSVEAPIAGLEIGFLELVEKQCARASGQ
jgi:ABC-type arginine transport system permease subunit